MRRRLFNIASLLSLLLCVASGALWARSLGHFEVVHLRYTHWPRPDESHSYRLEFAWYSNTLRLEVSCTSLTPKYFRRHPEDVLERARTKYAPGMQWGFIDGHALTLGGDAPGFSAGYWSYATGRPNATEGGRYHLSVRPWLPMMLCVVLPAIWYYRYRKARSIHAWQFGLRELLVGVTALAVILAAAIWLKN